MTKLIWLLVLAVSVAANDIQGVLPLPDELKVNDDVVPMIQIDPTAPAINTDNSKDLKPEVMLKPIGPIFPSFFQPGKLFEQFPQRNGWLNNNDQDTDTQPKKGMLTIILFKPKQFGEQEETIDDPSVVAKSGTGDKLEDLKDTAEKNFKTLTAFLLRDLFGPKRNEDQADSHAHLFGGNDDPDKFIRISGGDGFGDNDFIHFVKGDEMPLMSSEDIGRYRDVNFGGEDVEEESDEVKKCNLLKFLRLKAHIHYRTIIHLFFISGIILVILMFLSLTLKVNKRRNALRRFANKRNIDVASIDSAVAKQREAEGLSPRPQRSFRLGNLMLTFEQRMAPPAYDQIDRPENQPKTSSLVKSLASSYHKRYQPTSQDVEEDRKSLSSLPPYEEKQEPKN